jgi:exodeoxyribonuclease VII large subunit
MLDFQETNFLDINLKAKEIRDQISWVLTQRKSDLLPDLLTLKKHKSIQIRRMVADAIGVLGDEKFINELQHWQVEESDRKTWLLLETAIDKIQRKETGTDNFQTIRVFSVSEAILQIKNLVSEKEYIIEGELAEVKYITQMCYFGLKDKQDTRIDCSLFVGKLQNLNFPLNEGLSVQVRGKFRINKNSRLSFEPSEIKLTGKGELLRNYLLLQEKLRSEGLFDEDRKRNLKLLPKNILLLASSSSAALGDFTKTLNQRRQGITIYHLPIKTQGSSSEMDLIQKLLDADKLIKKYNIDTIVITRGGGSSDDLQVFNSEKVVRLIHSLKAPTIVAIGHERDTTLAEFVADKRASTPTQAAVLVSISGEEISGQLDNHKQFFLQYFETRKQEYLNTSKNLTLIISQQIQAKITFYKNISSQTDTLVHSLISNLRQENLQKFQQIVSILQTQIQEIKIQIQEIKNFKNQQIHKIQELKNKNQIFWIEIYNSQNLKVQDYKQKTNLYWQTINMYNPENILKQGYTLIWQNEKLITKSTELKNSKNIKIQFQDGKVEL